MSSEPRYKIFTRRSELAGTADFGEERLGGVVLYGASLSELRDAIGQLQAALIALLSRNPSVDRHSMNALLAKEAGRGISPRVLRAIIGSVLRKGLVSTFPAETEDGELIPIVCSPQRRPAFDSRVRELEETLRMKGEILIRDARAAFFPGEGSGAWSWTWHVAARAAYLGRVSFLDRYRVSWVGDFDHVLGTAR